MQKNLVIVESPAKAKTIEKFLGKDFKVLSSYGHIRDLKKKEFSIDVEKNFKPNYEIPADKKALVSTLKAEAKEARAARALPRYCSNAFFAGPPNGTIRSFSSRQVM